MDTFRSLRKKAGGSRRPSPAAARAGSEKSPEMGPHYRPYVRHLATLLFVLYATLYVADLFFLYRTFMPGYSLELLSIYRQYYFQFGRGSLMNGTPRMRFRFRVAAATWRFFVGRQYTLSGAVGYLSMLAKLSLWLELAAVLGAVLVVACLWWHSRRASSRPRRPIKQRSVFALVGSWNALGFYFTTLALTTPAKAVGGSKAIALVVALLAWFAVAYVGDNSTFLATHIPPSCQWQLALSLCRLYPFDLYKHQVGPAVGLIQLLLLVDMIRLARRARK